MRCFQCQRFGHITKICEEKRGCAKCSGDHEYGKCEGAKLKAHYATFLAKITLSMQVESYADGSASISGSIWWVCHLPMSPLR